MKEHVLEVNRKIERNDGDRHREPLRKWPNIEKTQFPALREHRNSNSAYWEQVAYECGIKCYDYKICRPACRAFDTWIAPRRQDFPQCHRNENKAE